MKVCCVFSLESPHRGDSNEYTQYIIFNIKEKITLNYPKSAAMGFFPQGTQKRVRNRRGKRAIRVRATEVLLYQYKDVRLPPKKRPYTRTYEEAQLTLGELKKNINKTEKM